MNASRKDYEPVHNTCFQEIKVEAKTTSVFRRILGELEKENDELRKQVRPSIKRMHEEANARADALAIENDELRAKLKSIKSELQKVLEMIKPKENLYDAHYCHKHHGFVVRDVVEAVSKIGNITKIAATQGGGDE
jgi:sugar-specific transcriptional regulator TrmB